jgi:hypothetical protein
MVTSFSGSTCDYTDADGGTWQAHRQILNELGMFDDIISEGVAQAHGASVCLLYSETDDIWFNGLEYGPAAKRTLYIALKHAQVAVEVVIEEDAAAGHLSHYSTLYITDRHVKESAMESILSWVKTGGVVFIEAAGASLNELNETNAARAALAPFESAGVWTGGIADNLKHSIMFEKQDLPNQQPLDHTAWSAAELGSVGQLGVFGEKEIVKMKRGSHPNTTVLARFESDDSPSVISTAHGHGQLVFALFHPGFAYFAPALPTGRPADRGSTDLNTNHWVPTNFSVAARQLIGTAAGTTKLADLPAVFSSEPLVEAGLVRPVHDAISLETPLLLHKI